MFCYLPFNVVAFLPNSSALFHCGYISCLNRENIPVMLLRDCSSMTRDKINLASALCFEEWLQMIAHIPILKMT